MAFQGFTSLFTNAYRGFGRYGVAATAGAGLTALAAPAWLKNDDRGYARTAAVTTPLIAAGYVAAPGLLTSVSDSASQWSGFWKGQPFDFEGGMPKWNPILTKPSVCARMPRSRSRERSGFVCESPKVPLDTRASGARSAHSHASVFALATHCPRSIPRATPALV